MATDNKKLLEKNKMSLKRFLSSIDPSPSGNNRRFCFVLGAGASKESGISTGVELVNIWMEDLSTECEENEYKSWMKNSDITKDNFAENYSKIYEKKFECDPRKAFSTLETLMEGKEPSCGYSVLAQVLAKKWHNMVITTNFDSLTEDALFIYTKVKPIVISHESLANYIEPFGTRPNIIKIHRDLFLNPKNTANETSKLDENFKQGLTNIFKYYTPIFIGYGGNDGSLMGFLEDIVKDGIKPSGFFWMYRNEKELSSKIIKTIEGFDGRAIQIKGFDDFMIQLGAEFNFTRQDDVIKEIAEKRAESYLGQYISIIKENETPIKTVDTKEINVSDEGKTAVNKMISQSKQDAWSFIFTAFKEKDIKIKENIFLNGLKIFPNNSFLLVNYANLLGDLKKFPESEEYYLKAIEVDGSNIMALVNYAFLLNKLERFPESEKYYLKAIEADGSNSIALVNYANLLNKLERFPESEKYYLKAIEADGSNSIALGNYASLLRKLERFPESEKYYLKAIEADGTYSIALGNYAKLKIEQKEFEEAKNLINKAFELQKETKNDLILELWFYRYAVFFDDYKGAKQQIEDLLSENIRAIDWPLKSLLKIAKSLNHPDYKGLCDLEKRITQK
ncbi:MAG: hypothetical protein COB02_10400 [Candidatus Cloacimonadota bacterium]|nr:MAG: hypothetical protein COB02_10400 [Candidatus Cloacimonadota bacterium]